MVSCVLLRCTWDVAECLYRIRESSLHTQTVICNLITHHQVTIFSRPEPEDEPPVNLKHPLNTERPYLEL